MKILLIGGNGGIGRRYQAVLQYLGIDFEILDTPGSFPKLKNLEFDKAIVATPTDAHYYYIRECLEMRKPVLSEKPVSKWADDVKSLKQLAVKNKTPAFVVNNYAFLLKEHPLPNEDLKTIFYRFYNTGRDGLLWDCCQLLYLALKEKAALQIERSGPIWTFFIGASAVPYLSIERSYIDMVKAFVSGEYDSLWTLEDAFKMTEAIEDLMRRRNVGSSFYYDPFELLGVNA